jgi:hypothetical protein
VKLPSDKTLEKYFKVRRASNDWKRVIAKRRAPVRPIPGLDNAQVQYMREMIYPEFGLEQYLQTWSGEMAARPIPFVSTDDKPLKTKTLYEKYAPAVYDYILPFVKPGAQSINKTSRLGYPVFSNPGDGIDRRPSSPSYGFQTQASKWDVFLSLLQPMYQGDFSLYKEGVHTEGCRTQNDPPDKVREQQFITADGVPYSHETTPLDRTILVPEVGELIGSRSRIITQAPVCNLALQCFDTLINNALGEFHLFDSNVYDKRAWDYEGELLTFDCKHYERYTGLCALVTAKIIGGHYGEVLDWMINYPVIVPSDDRTNVWEIKPIFGPGSYPQFYSGLSLVADGNKIVNACVQVAFFHEVLKLPMNTAIEVALSGTGHGLRRWNFGDDNRAVGEKGIVNAWFHWMSEYFVTERDEVPRYLGTVYRPDLRRWCLPLETYVIKGAQPERDYSYKDYPNLGLTLRRRTFIEYGEPEISSKVIPLEDDAYNAVGYPWINIVHKAHVEEKQAEAKSQSLNEYVTADKEYLMTEAEKIASGLYWYLTKEQTASIALRLVSPAIRAKLQFASMPDQPPPLPNPPTAPKRVWDYAGSVTKKEEEDEE